jgi:predicted nucleic acid-binding protein
VILDASVALKLYFREEGSNEARRIALDEALAAPDLIFAEVANAAWKKARRGEAGAHAAVSELGSVVSHVVPCATLASQALDLARTLEHPVYDCFYLALALRRQERLVTADIRFAAVVAASPYAATIRLLGAPDPQASPTLSR